MNFGFFVFTALLISMICGAIYLFKQVLDNVQFSKNPKVQRAAEIAVKVAIGLFACMLVYVVFKTALILLAPLFEQMNTAFDAAVSNLFDLLDKFIPYAVLGGIAVYWYKNKHPHPAPVDDDSVEVEVALFLRPWWTLRRIYRSNAHVIPLVSKRGETSLIGWTVSWQSISSTLTQAAPFL